MKHVQDQIVYGCTDETAFNFNSEANTDDGSCISIIYGCTDDTMFNYDSSANTDDGSCIPIIYGCTDSIGDECFGQPCNYDPNANTDDGSCEYGDLGFGCGTPCIDIDSNEICDCVQLGCTDSNACNFDPYAANDDGSCTYAVEWFNCDGSCVDLNENGICDISETGEGCTDPIACNFDPDATIEDGSCQYAECCECLGCTDVNACNYNSDASEDDGSCTYAVEWFNCDGTCIDLDNDGTCDLVDDCIADNNNICGCTDLVACNFNPNATDDDGSCDYGVECLISPCSTSEDPGIDGAYCIDNYCEGCCAIWYNSDGTIISDSCNENSNSMIGLWYDFDADQYIEITDSVIGFYSYIMIQILTVGILVYGLHISVLIQLLV